MDFEAAGLLQGLEGEERSARLALLERLASEGFGAQELRQAVLEDRLALLPLETVLGGSHSAREIGEQAGVPAAWLIRMRGALGLPVAAEDDRVFSADDIQAAHSLKLLRDSGMPEDSIVEATRVLGEGMARFAATVAAVFSTSFLRRGDSELDVALRYKAMAEQLRPATTPLLAAALSAHLQQTVRRGMIGREERESGEAAAEQDVVVCFADLVGFTALGGQVGAEELGSVAGRLAELSAELAVEPVRLVKTIGDAAMFVSAEPEPMVEIALALIDAVEAAELPLLRTGIASGPALQRAGDWYGHSVNLASRVTGVARPGSVLCTEEVRDSLAEVFAWSPAGRFRLKGLDGQLPLHRARRIELDRASEDSERETGRRSRSRRREDR